MDTYNQQFVTANSSPAVNATNSPAPTGAVGPYYPIPYAPTLSKSPKPVTVVTANKASTDYRMANAAMTAAEQNMQAKSSSAPQDPVITAALGDTPYDKLFQQNPAAAFYRSNGRLATPEELAKFQADNKIKTPNLDALNNALGDGNSDQQQPEQSDYEKQVNDINKKTEDAFNEYKTKLDQLANGTFQLNPAQQAQLDSMQKLFEQAKAEQLKANQNYEGGVRASLAASGASELQQFTSVGVMKNAIDQGVQKISELDAKMVNTLAQLKQAFQDDNLKLVRQSYQDFSDFQREQAAQITKLHDDATSFAKDQRDYNYKVEQDKLKNAMDSDKFTFDQKKEAFDEAIQQGKLNLDQAKFYQDKLKKTVKDANDSLTGVLTSSQQTGLDGTDLALQDSSGKKLYTAITEDILAGEDLDTIRDNLRTLGVDWHLLDDYDKIVNIEALRKKQPYAVPKTSTGRSI